MKSSRWIVILILLISSIDRARSSDVDHSAPSAEVGVLTPDQYWVKYENYLHAAIRDGIASRPIVKSNLHYAELALNDWEAGCIRGDSRRMLKAIDYAESTIDRQIPFGFGVFAAPLYAQFLVARTLVRFDRCEWFIPLPAWKRELGKLRESFR